MRLGLNERGVTELMATVDHASGLTKLAAGLRLELEGLEASTRPGLELLRPVSEEEAGSKVAILLGEIRTWTKEYLGIDRVPTLWLSLVHHPVYLDAVWKREQALMADGSLTRFQKNCIAYAIATNTVSPYMIDYYATILRRMGLDERGFLEVLAVVDYFNNLNVLADGMDIESDIRPYLESD